MSFYVPGTLCYDVIKELLAGKRRRKGKVHGRAGHLGLLVLFFSRDILRRQSDWSLSSDHGLDDLCDNSNMCTFP